MAQPNRIQHSGPPPGACRLHLRKCQCRRKTPPCRNCPTCRSDADLMALSGPDQQQAYCTETLQCVICACQCALPVSMACLCLALFWAGPAAGVLFQNPAVCHPRLPARPLCCSAVARSAVCQALLIIEMCMHVVQSRAWWCCRDAQGFCLSLWVIGTPKAQTTVMCIWTAPQCSALNNVHVQSRISAA